jgi:hypothetical protein
LYDASEWGEEFFTTRLDALKAEGRYRVFAELERRVGEFPRALETSSGFRRDGLVPGNLKYSANGFAIFRESKMCIIARAAR